MMRKDASNETLLSISSNDDDDEENKKDSLLEANNHQSSSHNIGKDLHNIIFLMFLYLLQGIIVIVIFLN
jgi:hypothetical protein